MSATPRLSGSFDAYLDLSEPAAQELDAHADASWGDRNIYGLILTYAGAAVLHQVKKISLVVDSTMESEAMRACSMRACMHVLLYAYRSYFSVRAARKWRFPPILPNTVLPPGHFVVVVVVVLYFVMPPVLRTRAQEPASSMAPPGSTCTHQPAYGCSSGPTVGQLHDRIGTPPSRSRSRPPAGSLHAPTQCIKILWFVRDHPVHRPPSNASPSETVERYFCAIADWYV